MITIKVNNKEYNVREAKTEEELLNGLKGVEELKDNEGMLFYLNDELNQQVFTMTGMKIPLDIIFFNLDLEAIDVKEDCKPGRKFVVSTTENMKDDDYIAYALEVNPGSGIKVGDELDIEDNGPVMKVLAQDGSTLMELWGNERIFSRKNTRVLIKKAKKADESKSDNDYKTLGRFIFKCIKILDNRLPEYVNKPQ